MAHPPATGSAPSTWRIGSWGNMISDAWLIDANKRLSELSIPIDQRDVSAVMMWQRETGERKDIFNGYPEVFAFFEKLRAECDRTPRPSGVFYFGGQFWPLVFPIFYGRNVFDLRSVFDRMGMPAAEAHLLFSNKVVVRDAVGAMGDCLDWMHGFPREGSSNNLTFADENLGAADRHLRGAAEVLLSRDTRSASMLLLAHALENALKAFLAHFCGLTDAGARKLNHSLPRILDQVLLDPRASDLRGLSSHLKHYPDVIQDRYKALTYSDGQLWEAYKCTSFGAAAVIRALHPGLNYRAAYLSALVGSEAPE